MAGASWAIVVGPHRSRSRPRGVVPALALLVKPRTTARCQLPDRSRVAFAARRSPRWTTYLDECPVGRNPLERGFVVGAAGIEPTTCSL